MSFLHGPENPHRGSGGIVAGPQLKKKRTFENENVMIGGATESEENPFEAIFNQNQTKIGVALPSDVAQFLANGSRDVFSAGLVTIATLDTGA